MAVELSLPAIGTVIFTALIDSINPCAIGVMILLISTMIVLSHKRGRMLKIGLIYIAAVYLTYFLAGLGLTTFFYKIPLKVAEYISISVAAIVIVGGLIEIKDYFWYARGFSLAIPASKVKTIEKYARNTTTIGVIILGIFVAAVELPCTGGPYLAITLLLSRNFSMQAVYLLAFYNLIFVLPLVTILIMSLFGTRVHNIKKWKFRYRKYMRLAAGIIMILLGLLLIFIANGQINLG